MLPPKTKIDNSASSRVRCIDVLLLMLTPKTTTNDDDSKTVTTNSKTVEVRTHGHVHHMAMFSLGVRTPKVPPLKVRQLKLVDKYVQVRWLRCWLNLKISLNNIIQYHNQSIYLFFFCVAKM
jgi:hypothetical protein